MLKMNHFHSLTHFSHRVSIKLFPRDYTCFLYFYFYNELSHSGPQLLIESLSCVYIHVLVTAEQSCHSDQTDEGFCPLSAVKHVIAIIQRHYGQFPQTWPEQSERGERERDHLLRWRKSGKLEPDGQMEGEMFLKEVFFLLESERRKESVCKQKLGWLLAKNLNFFLIILTIYFKMLTVYLKTRLLCCNFDFFLPNTLTD